MGTVNEIVNLIASFMIFLGSIIALISSIGLVKFHDVFLRSHAATKSSTLSLLLTLVGVIVFFISYQGYFSVRMILALVFINLTSPVGGHLISRAAYRTGAYMYRKSDTTQQVNTLRSNSDTNSFEQLKRRALERESLRQQYSNSTNQTDQD
ncbi:Na+/H+ antiporter subunit G [Staphylococcus auricularis]|uniref:Cation:proton antiporter n=1 Tax=Staphylococcus auricularis TaxID=29379 RepID=A0ABX5IFX3_9STAP|nr:Na+/H+ antiporter subunit G [Staphylococcus auricularis]MCE5038769.1 Na+/H+ antiporter subunit G [Staphylococcus auricularis]MEB6570570.1 Na+/H+ antiporter subunit G [Staphylococcus auricularis]PTH18201.1 cation:proton antiporter [Staphylococcus auricularis]PTH27026.1 cation:proton antiporter [Staphylococcus auricularis]